MGQERVSLLPQGLGLAYRSETIHWVKESWQCLDHFTNPQKMGPLPSVPPIGNTAQMTFPTHSFPCWKATSQQLLNHQLQFTRKAVCLAEISPWQFKFMSWKEFLFPLFLSFLNRQCYVSHLNSGKLRGGMGLNGVYAQIWMRQNNPLHYAKHMCDQTLSHPKTFPRCGKYQRLTHNSPSQERFLPEPCLHSTHGCINAHPILSAASISLWHKGIYPLYSQANKGENKT